MTVKIGTVIKALRNKKKITQDELATYLGVTPQAVSRWESEACYPDIEILPSIASFFDITIDELLDVNKSEKEKRRLEIKNEIRETNEVAGHNEESLKSARLYAAEFPSDEYIQLHLANEICRVHMWKDDPDKTVLSEAEKLYQILIENTNNSDLKYHSIKSLASLYANGFKNNSLAKSTIDTLPSVYYSRETAYSQIFGKLGKLEPIQQYIITLTNILALELREYIAYKMPNEPEHWDKKIKMLHKVIELFDLVYGDDKKIYHNYIGDLYRYIATYTIAQGKKEETLNYLEKMVSEYEKASDSAECESEIFQSSFLDKTKLGSVWKYDSQAHTHSFYVFNKLSQERYNSIRETDAFKSVVEKLSKLSK